MSAGATALEASVLVNAHGSWTARIVSAFIDVAATDGRISSVTRLAHTLGRIGWSALAVDSASVSLARAFTFIAIFSVGVVRRRANAFSGLDASFVGCAFRVRDASHLAGSANTFVRISSEIGRALAVKTAWTVEALRSKSAGGLSIFLTFVDIFT